MNLQEWRAQEDLTMSAASLRLDIPQPTISRIERGVHLPNSTTVAKLISKSKGAITAADLYATWQRCQTGNAA